MVFYCNHCGKKINEKFDYIDYDIDFDELSYTVDLCAECKEKMVEEIDGTITKFVRGV